MRGARKYRHVIETPEPGKWELAGYEASLPITEKSNPITKEIDRADPAQIVQLLKECDAEIFQEEDDSILNYKRLYSESILTAMTDVAKKVQEVIKDPEDSLIVLSGCGTSGRLAFLLANSFNQLLKGLYRKPCYSYIIAGGDRTLVMPQEAHEDKPLLGVEEVSKVCEGKRRVVFIGISCGLSAPYVAGQLDFCMNNMDSFTPVMVGLNPVNMARNDNIAGWNLTFRQVAERMQKLHELRKAFILNPAVGPEGITGASRMKGGSAAKIILETLLLAAHRAMSNNTEVTEAYLLEILRTYERVHKITYSQSRKIAAVVKQAGTSLQKQGHIYYLGWQNLGVMGIMDATECTPTFGADFCDVRAFIGNGYKDLDNREGDLTDMGLQYAVSHEDFVKNILPSVTENDTVILIFTLDDDLKEVEKMVQQVKENTSHFYAISHATVGQYIPSSVKKLFPSLISIMWPILFAQYEGFFLQKFQRQLCTKWILNAVSTGAHIIKGKIYSNYMVDLKVSNSKLFNRALYILQKFTGRSQAKCLEVLLKSIYNTEDLTDEITNAEISKHIEISAHMNKVVPTAVLALSRNCSIKEARNRLDSFPVIREAIEATLSSPGRKRSAHQIEATIAD